MLHTPNQSRSSSQTAQPAQAALFVSDVHLQEAMPRTTEAFLAFLRTQAAGAQRLYLLGDLFEYWAGDDDIEALFNRTVVDEIRRVSDTGTQVFWIAGNRDFLVGDRFARMAGVTLLSDPHVETFNGQRVTLTHGDAQCTDDLAYMKFRAEVRQPEWQRSFLAMPLEQRKRIIAELRAGSREAQRAKSYEIMDVNNAAIDSLFDASAATLMIHGHTHRPARHVHSGNGQDRIRYVLPDWDCDMQPIRGGWLAIGLDGVVRRFGVDGTALD